MKKVLFGLLICIFISGCHGFDAVPFGWNGEILVMQLGYETEVEGSGRNIEHSDVFNDANFVGFSSVDEIKLAQSYQTGVGATRNRYQFADGTSTFVVKTYPRQAVVNSVSVKSSNPSVLEVLKVEGTSITVRTHTLGDADLKVTVEGDKNTMEASYPIRVFTPVDINFYITPFWLNAINVRVRYKVCNMPPGVKEMVTEVKDSVSVVGYCEYYDFNRSSNKLVRRDTLRYYMKDRVDRFRKNKRLCLRNLTEGCAKIRNDWGVWGNHYVQNIFTGEWYLENKKYKYVIEQVIVDVNAVCDNPYVEFNFATEEDKSFDHYVEETDKVEDTGNDDVPEEDSDIPPKKLTQKTINYFIVQLNTFMSDSERDKMIEELNKELNNLGFNEELSDKEKDRQLDEINKHKIEGDE